MQIAEAFVKLGIIGGEKSSKELKEVSGNIGDIKTSSIAAKAAILGVVYGLERLMQGSLDRGAGLVQLANVTGMTADRIGDLRYAFRQLNVDASEVDGTLTSFQSRMNEIARGAPRSAEFQLFFQKTHFDQARLTDIPYGLQKANEYIKDLGAEAPKMINTLAGALGLSPKILSAFVMNNKLAHPFNFSSFNKGQKLSAEDAKKLYDAEIKTKNMHANFDLKTDQLVAEHGTKLVSEFEPIVNELIKIVGNLATIAENLRVFRAAGVVTGGWGKLMDKGEETSADIAKNGFMKGSWHVIEGMQDARRGAGMMFMEWLTGAGKSVYNSLPAPSNRPSIDDLVNEAMMKHYLNQQSQTQTNNNEINVYTETPDPRAHGEVIQIQLNRAASENKSNLWGN